MAVQTGQAAIGERLLSAHQDENPLFGLDSIPFLATSFEDSKYLWKAARRQIAKVLADQNLILLYSVPWPPQGIYFKHKIHNLTDMSGVKFRAYNAATTKLAELTNMQPVHIEAAELNQALESSLAEAFISSSSTGYYREVWKHLNYFYNVQAWLPRNYVFVNAEAFEKMDIYIQDCLYVSGTLAGFKGTLRAEQVANEHLAQLTAQGMNVLPPNEPLASGLAEIGTTMLNDWLEIAGEEGAKIIEDFHTLKANDS